MTREEKLIQKIKQGDLSAADELIAMYYPEILRYCLWHAPDRSLAEDAVQETFLKALRYFDRYTHRGKFKSFLYRIAANTGFRGRPVRYGTETARDRSTGKPAGNCSAAVRAGSDPSRNGGRVKAAAADGAVQAAFGLEKSKGGASP